MTLIPARPLRILLFSAALAAPAAASDLTLDGTIFAQVPFGGALTIELAGAAGSPAFVYLDVSPGPAALLGESVPLGLTPALQLVAGGTTDGMGVFATPFFLAENPAFAGATVFLAGVVLDPSDPNGLDVSNGATLEITPKVGAGLNQTTLVGRTIVFDGSGATLADGTLPAGTAVSWQLVEAPAGSGAALQGAQGLFPALAPDVPGDYVVEVAVTAGGSTSTDRAVAHAFELELTPALDGAYVLPAFASVQGTVTGPDLAALSLNGDAVTVAGGAFGPLLEALAPTRTRTPTGAGVASRCGCRERATPPVRCGFTIASSARCASSRNTTSCTGT